MNLPPEWAPDLVIDSSQAHALIRAHFPRFADAEVRLLATGWDNTVFLVGDAWLFRFPRREVALPGLRREMAVLPRLAPHLPLAVPVPEYVCESSPDFPWPFWGTRLIPGRELAVCGIPAHARTAAAAATGGFLRVLHSLTDEVGAELPVDPIRRADPAVRLPKVRHFLGRLVSQGLYVVSDAVEEILAAASELPAPEGPFVLSHADLHIRHVLLADSGEVSGIIDWGDVCRAGPAVDLSLAYAAFEGPSRTAFLGAYGEISAESELRARMIAIFLSAVLADYAAALHDTPLLTEALAALPRAAT